MALTLRTFRLILAMTAPPSLLACSCVAPDKGACGLVNGAEAIFTGRVVAEQKAQWVTTYTFLVSEAFRGRGVSAGLPVKVVTNADGASCGAGFAVGEEYLVYAGIADGEYGTSLCSGNDLVKNAQAQLRFLSGTGQDAIAKGTPLAGFVFGSVTNREADLQSRGEPSWPVGGVKVKAVHTSSGSIAAETLTANDGSYEFFSLPPGRYHFDAEPPGVFRRQADSPESHDVQPGACVKQSFFRAQRAVLEVRLIDSEGEAADSSTLHLEPVDTNRPREDRPDETSELIAEDETDEGKYRFSVPPGRYRLGFKEHGYTDLHYYPEELVLRAEHPVTLRYRLPKRPEQIVQALVLGADGRPLVGVKVRIAGHTPDGFTVWGDVVTPANGRIQFAELAPGDYELIAEAPGCPASVKVARGEQNQVRIVCRQQR